MAMAIASMPTDIYQVCAWNVGTVKTEPWRRKLPAMGIRAIAYVSRALAWMTEVSAHWRPVAALGALVVAVTMIDQLQPTQVGLLHAVPALAAPRIYQAAGVEIDQQIAANVQAGVEIDAAINALITKVSADKRDMTDEERGQLTTLRGRKTTNNEFRATLTEQKASNAQLMLEAETQKAADKAPATVSALRRPNAL